MSKFKYSYSTYSGRSTLNSLTCPTDLYEKEEHTLFAANSIGEQVRVGTARIYKVFCSLAESHGITLDSLFDSTQDFRDIFYELCASECDDDSFPFESWDEALATFPVIVLDRLQIESRYRGNGLASQFLAHLIATVPFRGEAIIALNAQPFEIQNSDTQTISDSRREQERQRLIRLYSALGFKRINETSSVMYLLAS